LGELHLDSVLDRIIERAQSCRLQKVAQFVQGYSGVKDQVGKNGGNDGFRAREYETQHCFPGCSCIGDRKYRGNKRHVKGNEDVIGNHPAFLQEGFFAGSVCIRKSGGCSSSTGACQRFGRFHGAFTQSTGWNSTKGLAKQQ
jgi:hypothetical protein